MASGRGNEDDPYPGGELLREIADDLLDDGIEIRFVVSAGHTRSPVIDAWNPSNPNRVAVIECDAIGLSHGTADCLATTIRELLRADVETPTHVTWDHTGTLWPD